MKILSEIVSLTKSLLWETVASWAKQALSNSVLRNYFKLSVSLNFWILPRNLESDPQAL